MRKVIRTNKFVSRQVLIFFVKDGKVVLARKKKKIGRGCLNGYGGKTEKEDLSSEDAVAREVFRECRVKVLPENMRKVGLCYFTNIKDDNSQFVCQVEVFISNKWDGDFQESDEMGPAEIFGITKLPDPKELMAADRFWWPHIFAGRKVVVNATMKHNQTELVFVNVNVVDSLD